MKTIKQKYLIHAPISAVWEALVNPSVIDKWGGGPAIMSDKAGIEFSLWGGDIHGKNIKAIKDKELVQDWLSGNWKTASKVTFTLREISDKTELSLLHEDVPEEEVKDIDDGWKEYYIGPLKELLEK